jgi:hypothetical protein
MLIGAQRRLTVFGGPMVCLRCLCALKVLGRGDSKRVGGQGDAQK